MKGTFSHAESYFVILVDYPASHANKLQGEKKKKKCVNVLSMTE